MRSTELYNLGQPQVSHSQGPEVELVVRLASTFYPALAWWASRKVFGGLNLRQFNQQIEVQTKY